MNCGSSICARSLDLLAFLLILYALKPDGSSIAGLQGFLIERTQAV
jgi:hypothetical protein